MPKKASTRTRTRAKQVDKEPEVVNEEVVTVEAKAEEVINEEQINRVVEERLSALRQSLIEGASKEADNDKKPEPLQKAGSRNAFKLNRNNKDVVPQREGMRVGPARPHKKDVNTKEVVNKDIFYIKD